jgi:hypothetical protein
MPALNAIRLNPEFKAMVKAGKPAKVAIVAIMRKLVTGENGPSLPLTSTDTTGVASGRTGVRAKADIPLRALNNLHRPLATSPFGVTVGF